MVDALAAKYGVSGASADEPNEEAFAAARERQQARRAQGDAAGGVANRKRRRP